MPQRYNLTTLEKKHILPVTTTPPKVFYDMGTAAIFAHTITELNSKCHTTGKCFGQQMMLKKGLEKFGKEGRKAAIKEATQLHDWKCFVPIIVAELSKREKQRAQVALMFLTEKKDGLKKGRVVYNGKPTRGWVSKQEAHSPTAALESITLTCVIDAKENRDVMTADVPNAFIQAPMPTKYKNEKRVIMKSTGALVNILVTIDSTYSNYVVYEKKEKFFMLKYFTLSMIWSRQRYYGTRSFVRT
jgi:hypothetical protein